MTNDEIVAELKSVVALFGKVGRRADTELPKSKKYKTDKLKEVLAYLRICVKYTLFEKEAQNRENRKHIRELKAEVKDLGRDS